ncbi:hypothetical protein Lumi_011 [Xylophilus phage Lumi]|nr:hypothetical protein Lumi_011 [Xylophilus phage Lumi]
MAKRSLTELTRRAPAVLLAGLRDADNGNSLRAADKLLREAKDFGLSFGDFLDLACDPRQSGEAAGRFLIAPNQFLSGRDAAMLELSLPMQNNFDEGVLLQMASDTFQTYPGTRAMFPQVIDGMLQWKNRQSQLENLSALISQSRTISGNEMITTVVEDDSAERGTFIIAEFGEIPVRTITTSEKAVKFYKHGSGIRTSYEFERRASLDILTPFAARVARELEISKVRAATNVLLTGDGINPAATTEGITAFDGEVVAGNTRLRTQYNAIATWLVSKAAEGRPIDTIVGNLKMYLELLFMFSPTLPSNYSQAEVMAGRGAPSIDVALPLLNGNVKFALSSGMPNDKLLGYSKAETLEELVEAGSSINENEKAITNQTITYVKTENSGFRLAFPDTRFVLDTKA